jgi:hypothetical protein
MPWNFQTVELNRLKARFAEISEVDALRPAEHEFDANSPVAVAASTSPRHVILFIKGSQIYGCPRLQNMNVLRLSTAFTNDFLYEQTKINNARCDLRARIDGR